MPRDIPALLTPITLNLDQILLDPNNPRFAELDDARNPVPERRYAEESVQANAYGLMKRETFAVSELRDTIESLGFLPMDRIVVRRWKNDPEKYVVVEGNRRVTALRWLLELNAKGVKTLIEEQVANVTTIHCLLLDSKAADTDVAWILPGLRHVSGIKEWGAYQKARAVYQLRESGVEAQEAAQSLGLSTRKANALWRSYLGLKQMMNDEEFGDKVETTKYSYFEELFKKRRLWEEWLDWSDEEKKFKNTVGLREFYEWMMGDPDETDEDAEPKLPEAKSIRRLGDIFADERALAAFRGSGGNLDSASAQIAVDKAQDWTPAISAAEVTLSTLSADTIRKMSDADVKVLEMLQARILQLIADRKALGQA